MKNRKNRHRVIGEIIKAGKISSQGQLKSRLAALGFNVTQATLSRDLLAMQVIKLADAARGHIYALPDPLNHPSTLMEDDSPLHACRSLAFSGNLAILKCLPSFAPSIALLLDRLQMKEIIGTVAGDDTILIVLRQGAPHTRFRDLLVRRFPDLRDRF